MLNRTASILVTNTGITFEGEVPVATLTPHARAERICRLWLLGIYVGVIPVALGLLWYPGDEAHGTQMVGSILALTVGLLVFLLVDTFLEVLETGAALPGVFQGVPLAMFAALLTWLVIMAVSRRSAGRSGSVHEQRGYCWPP